MSMASAEKSRLPTGQEDDYVKRDGRALRAVKEYADATSIHGIKYTMEQGRPILERFVVQRYFLSLES